MAGVSLHNLPDGPRVAWLRLRDQLREILGDDLVAMWAHGGTTAIDDPPHAADLDTYVLLARQPGEDAARTIEQAHDAIAREHAVEWDAWYVLASAAGRSDAPRHAFRGGRRDTSWALHRAHWLAGRYVRLHGPEPGTIVMAPTWDELRAELDRELEHLERHVLEGDTDPFEATYAILTGARILHALQTGSVVVSKRAAGTWALEHLSPRWHAALQAAARNHEDRASADDIGLLAAEMAPFVAFVRAELPPSPDRPSGSPRWSGY